MTFTATLPRFGGSNGMLLRGLGGHLRGGKFSQFVIDKGKQLVGGLTVALLGGFDQLGQFRHKGLVYMLLTGPSPGDYGTPEHSAPIPAGSQIDDRSDFNDQVQPDWVTSPARFCTSQIQASFSSLRTRTG